MLSPSQTQTTVATFMIALLPQSGQRHLRANGLADEAQWHWLSGCFMANLLGTFTIKAAVQTDRNLAFPMLPHLPDYDRHDRPPTAIY